MVGGSLRFSVIIPRADFTQILNKSLLANIEQGTKPKLRVWLQQCVCSGGLVCESV